MMPQHRSRPNATRAFTLLELLIVIAILALLAALLFPVFARTREKARSGVCLTNLRQIGMAVAEYAQDYDELYPYGADPVDKYSLAWGVDPTRDALLKDMPLLHQILMPYCKEVGIWRCPSDTGYEQLLDLPDPNGGPLQMRAQPSAFEAFGSSYSYRTEIAFRHLIYGASGYRERQEVSAAEVLIITDTCGAWHGNGSRNDMQGWRYNAVFADGHAISLNRDAYSTAWSLDLYQKPDE